MKHPVRKTSRELILTLVKISIVFFQKINNLIVFSNHRFGITNCRDFVRYN